MDGNNPRILIARMSAVGDTVLTLPVLCALREHLPDAYLAWLVEERAAPLLRGHDCLDELIVLPRRWFKSARTVMEIRQHLQALKLDVTIDPQSVTKTAGACWLSGAKLRIGCAGKYGAELSPWFNNKLVEPIQPHITDRSMELLLPLGIEAKKAEFRVPVDPQAKAKVDEFLAKQGLTAGFATINPGGSWDSKLWPVERYAQIARLLGEDHNLPTVVVFGGQREHDWAREIVADSGGHAMLAPETSLTELAAIFRAARLVVGSDTGPLHIAAAVGTPCVGMYGPTRPCDCGPYGPKNVALQDFYQAGSRRERRRAENLAMRAIEVAGVYEACCQILDRQPCSDAGDRAA